MKLLIGKLDFKKNDKNPESPHFFNDGYSPTNTILK